MPRIYTKKAKPQKVQKEAKSDEKKYLKWYSIVYELA
jgi:hypothetical protein